MTKKIGVLALQGAVTEHLQALTKLGVTAICRETARRSGRLGRTDHPRRRIDRHRPFDPRTASRGTFAEVLTQPAKRFSVLARD